MNEVVELLKNRCSIRAFTDEKLAAEELQNLIDCALASPSGANLQKWHFSFVTDKAVSGEIEDYLLDRVFSGDNDFIKKLIESRNRKIFFNAPLVVFISTEGGASPIDAGVAVENIVIAAEAMGLRSCILGGCRDAFNLEKGEYFKKLAKFPEGYEFNCGVAIGRPAMTGTPHERLSEKVTVI